MLADITFFGMLTDNVILLICHFVYLVRPCSCRFFRQVACISSFTTTVLVFECVTHPFPSNVCLMNHAILPPVHSAKYSE